MQARVELCLSTCWLYTHASYFEGDQLRKIVVLVVVDMRLSQQPSRDAAEAPSGMRKLRGADSEAESDEFSDSSDYEHSDSIILD